MVNIKNPDAFNYETAIILSALYDAFPNSANWTLDEDNEMYPTDTGVGRADTQAETLWWLRDHGYIEAQGRVANEFRFIKLTPLGLECLKKVPSALGKKETMIDLIKAEVAKKSVGSIGLLIAYFIQKYTGSSPA